MKKIIKILFSCMMVFVLCSCGGEMPENNNGNNEVNNNGNNEENNKENEEKIVEVKIEDLFKNKTEYMDKNITVIGYAPYEPLYNAEKDELVNVICTEDWSNEIIINNVTDPIGGRYQYKITGKLYEKDESLYIDAIECINLYEVEMMSKDEYVPNVVNDVKDYENLYIADFYRNESQYTKGTKVAIDGFLASGYGISDHNNSKYVPMTLTYQLDQAVSTISLNSRICVFGVVDIDEYGTLNILVDDVRYYNDPEQKWNGTTVIYAYDTKDLYSNPGEYAEFEFIATLVEDYKNGYLCKIDKSDELIYLHGTELSWSFIGIGDTARFLVNNMSDGYDDYDKQMAQIGMLNETKYPTAEVIQLEKLNLY